MGLREVFWLLLLNIKSALNQDWEFLPPLPHPTKSKGISACYICLDALNTSPATSVKLFAVSRGTWLEAKQVYCSEN